MTEASIAFLPETKTYFDEETWTIAEASLILGWTEEKGLQKDCPYYFFNRIKSNRPGRGGGTKVLKQMLEFINSVNIPLINCPNAYGNLSLEELVGFYKKHGFVSLGPTFGDKVLVYPAKFSS